MRAARALAAQRGHLLHWAPVCLGTGIGIYFALPAEPGAAAGAGIAAALPALGVLAWRGGAAGRPLALAALLILAGLALAWARAGLVAAPVPGFPLYGPVEGRVVAVDRSASGRPRLTLDRVWIGDLAAPETPARIRISLHGKGPVPLPGARVMTTAFLIPPPGPSEPGGFDFRRMAWFQRLGAVGYTRVPVLRAAPGHGGGPVIRLARARLDLAAAIRARVPGQEGAVAAAILTGDRSAISDRTTEALRRANLSHLLAISGLHMGLLAGFVFWAARAALALVPALALRLPAKKVAAIAALCAGAGYLALSGASVATQRAFVMAAVMLAAVLADRRAITLRAVALAALIVLAMRPESLMTAGFQMSFAATTALVAAFGAVRETRLWRARAGPFRRVMALILSSAVAGAATAPFAAAHFNRIAEYGLVANLLAVPVMGAVVMPAAVVAGLAAPLGLAGLPLLAMQLGLGWILWVAGRIAALGGAVIPVPASAPAVLALLSFGLLFFLLWQGRGRLAGIALAVLALGLWVTGERPALLVAGSGRLIGVMTAEGRALSKPEGDGYTARLWLENDGDAAGQREAFARPGLKRAPGWTEARVAGTRFVLLSGRHWEEALGRACASGWVILPHPARTAPAPPGCRLIGTERLSEAGAMAIRTGTGGPRLITAADLAGRRPWAR